MVHDIAQNFSKEINNDIYKDYERIYDEFKYNSDYYWDEKWFKNFNEF